MSATTDTMPMRPCLAFDAQDACDQMSSYLKLLKQIKVTGMRNTLASTRVVPADMLEPVIFGTSVCRSKIKYYVVNVASHVVLPTRALAFDQAMAKRP